MTQPITRITRKLHSWPVTATLAGSDTPAGITAVTVAFLRPDTNPTGSTVFTAAAWNNGYATVPSLVKTQTPPEPLCSPPASGCRGSASTTPPKSTHSKDRGSTCSEHRSKQPPISFVEVGGCLASQAGFARLSIAATMSAALARSGLT